MDVRRKSSDGSSRPPPRPRRPSASLPCVPLQRSFDQTSAQGQGGGPLTGGVARRTSAGNLRSTAFDPANSTTAHATIRAVTPEPTEHGAQEATGSNSNTPGAIVPGTVHRGFGSSSPQNSSPRSIPTVSESAMSSASRNTRPHGGVFNDYFPSSFDGNSSSPPPRPSSIRPRGHTMDNTYRQPSAASPPVESTRHRMGSVSSSGSLGSMPPHEDASRGPQLPRHSPVLESASYPAVYPSRPTDLHIQTSGTTKDKKGSTRAKLMKRVSRPTSPLISPPPSVDALPLPVPTDDANKILLLMKTLCGRMRGDAAYQVEANGPWYSGLCYIEEEKGSLMFDSGENGPFHTALIHDLRGCRVLPIDRPGVDRSCLEIANPQSGVNVAIWPQVAEESDLWLAALLCWQQVRPSPIRLNSQATTPISQSRPDISRRGSSTMSTSSTIIKVSRVALWDKGAAHTPRAIAKRASSRDLRSPQTGWRKVSCILSDNGELKLITEYENTVLSVISLSQLSRCAIQQLDKSVLDEDFCLAIFPIYASTSTQLSIFRPVYISLDHRVLFEVWFVLLRAFTTPEIYAIDQENDDQVLEITDVDADLPFDEFRVEKTINLRVIEAKLGGPTSPHTGTRDRHGKAEHDASVGNYFAEVMLDGDVRARTIMKTETRNPFWRDDCEFADLPANLPYLSVVLKRVDGNLEGTGHQLQASFGFPKSSNLVEVNCGSVDIPLQQLERAKDHEQWLQICDEKQQTIGTLLCKIRHEEVVVFMAKDYQPLSEMLHKFSSGLTTQICEALPGQLRRLAETFLNIFQVSNNASEWLMALVEDEIDGIGQQAQMKKLRFSRRLKSTEALDVANANEREALRDMGKSLAGEANLLFRGNSLLTQALEFHMRRLGNDYIDEVLGDKIFEINEINPNCEVDPGKLQSGEDLSQHWERLLQFTNEIWDCIANSANKFPPELRHILKYIRAVAEDRYGDFLRTVAFTSVSGFLFLRFICPAILNPKLFGLLRDYPRPRAQRTLTLIAKALQALANLSNIGKKEVWMEPMNRFLTARRQGLKDFIDNVCAIPAERSNCILPASYSTPITILGRLSPRAREGFPSLPYLVDHARNFATLVKLWVDNQPQGVAESRYEGDLLKFHRYCVSLQQRADLCMTRIDYIRAADNENASQPTDSESLLAEAMDHVTFAEAVNMIHPKPGNNAWMDHERPPGSSGASSLDDERGPGSRGPRSADKWASGLRQAVSGDPLERRHHTSQNHNTVKTIRNGKNAKRFLSGFLRKMDRSASPDASSGGGPSGVQHASTTPTSTSKSRDKDKARSAFGGLADAWKEFDPSNKH